MVRILFLAIAILLPRAVLAQDLASLVADTVHVERDSTLVAEGRVEVLYRDVRLRASRVTYDRMGDRITVDGPITLDDGDGVVILADMAALDPDLQNGILRSARMVLEQQLQLAATQIARVGGRYTQLSNTVASSCEICAANPTPTWEIRARRVIHDSLERQLYFDGATFRLLGIPVAYFPRLRLPDPSRERSTGFLVPRVRTTSRLGTGFKLPYFVELGDHADLRLTPYLSGSTTTLETIWRQTFRTGALQFDGALTNDDLSDDTRYYLFGRGTFDLPRDFQLEFDVERVSDESYLIDYGYSEIDRLETGLRIFRARRKDLFNASIIGFDTLRNSELPISDQLPTYYGTVDYERAVPLGGGELIFDINAASLSRSSTIDRDGRDTDRFGAAAEYRQDWIWASGLVGVARGGLSGTIYHVSNDDRFDDAVGRLSPHASAELRLPLSRAGRDGVRHLLEPVAQLAWSDVTGGAVPNEDSILLEFDEGNLLSLSRFPGKDRIETGVRASIGLRYTRVDPTGWTLGAVAGRVLRATDENDLNPAAVDGTGGFTAGSGLAGTQSDWLAAAELQLGGTFALGARAIFDDDLELTRNEARLGYDGNRLALETAYVFLNGDRFENRPRDTHELSLDGGWRLSRHWTGTLDARYDFDADRAQRTGVGLEYRSECIVVDLSVARRFTETETVSPSTEFGFGLSLVGLGSGASDASYRKRCNG